MTDRVLLYADKVIGAYGYEEKPWFLPQVRLEAFMEQVYAQALDQRVEICTSPMAEDADLLRFHTAAYLERIRAVCATNQGALDEGVTLARSHVERAASHVVGAVMDASRRIVAGDCDAAFVPIAGFHHATADQARLYCLYNDAAVVISWLLCQLSGKIAYIDIDVHQGDGVYESFAEQPRVVIADLHEDSSTLFPYSPECPGTGKFAGRSEARGRGPGLGTKLNIALCPYTTDELFLAHWRRAEAFIEAQRPEWIIFVSGVDALAGDPLANQRLTLGAIREVTQSVRRLAERHCEGRLLVLGGGGYCLDNVAQGWATVLDVLTS